jgi:hypothetical protein
VRLRVADRDNHRPRDRLPDRRGAANEHRRGNPDDAGYANRHPGHQRHPSGTPAGTPGGSMTYPDMVNLAVKQLATDNGIPESQIQVVSYGEAEWSDSSLGCPQPGQAYLTVITPGYRVILKANGVQYEYHTNLKGMVIRCPR